MHSSTIQERLTQTPMWSAPPLELTTTPPTPPVETATRLGESPVRKTLLVCGVVSSLIYVVINDLVAASLYGSYSRVSQAVSELSAIDAPSRPILVPLIVIYEALLIAFGIGVWQSAHYKRTLRITGGHVIGNAVLNVVALLFPMSRRPAAVEAGATVPFTDTMHIVLLGAVTPLLMFLFIAFGAAAMGTRFRIYSILTLVVLVGGGVLTGTETARVTAGEPAAWLGLAERTAIGAYLLWIAVLATALGRRAPRAELPVSAAAAAPAASNSGPVRSGAATITAFIKRHPVLTYYVLVFAISVGGPLVIIGGPGRLPGTSGPVGTLFPLALLTLYAGPVVAGPLTTVLVAGRSGQREILARLLRWRVGARWYAVALLTVPLLMMAIYVPLSRISPEFAPRSSLPAGGARCCPASASRPMTRRPCCWSASWRASCSASWRNWAGRGSPSPG
jgi:hypothetical protein